MGITRGETKRALVEQFSEIDGDDLLIDILPDDGLPLPMPEDMPPNPSLDLTDDTYGGGRSMKHKLTLIAGLAGLVGLDLIGLHSIPFRFLFHAVRVLCWDNLLFCLSVCWLFSGCFGLRFD